MKKLRKVYFAMLILTTFIFGGGLILSSNKNTAHAADAPFAPNYLSVHKYKVEGDVPVKISTPIRNKDAVLLDSNQIFIFELGQQSLDTAQFAISTAILRVSVNGVEISNKSTYLQTSTLGGQDTEFKYITVALNPYAQENPDLTGKYEIFVRYMEHEKINGVFYNATERNVSFNFYLYKTSTYLTSNAQPSVLIENTSTTVTEGSASLYNKTHYFNYNNNLSGLTSLSLPSITFNSNLFELEITKTYSGQNSQTKIYKDNSGNLVVTNNIVLVYKNENEINVAFNDIGAYTVKFIFIHRNTDGTRDLLENLTTTIRPDLVNVFGFQLFHADINASTNNASKEFKVINADNKLERQYQTDITFAFYNKTLTETSRGDKFVLQNLTGPAVNFNTKDLPQVPVTNQAPVTFKYNANIEAAQSYYYELNSFDAGLEENLWTKHTNYNGSSFTKAGTYLVKLVYKSNLALNNEFSTQWFYFTISTKTPEFSVKVNGVNLSNQSYTKETVEVAFNEINSPFNSSVSLKVYTKPSLSAAYGNPVTIAEGSQSYFSANGIYKVVLAFGKNQSKDISTEFIIDSSPITGLTARNVVTNNMNKKVKSGAVSFFTNESVALEWNNKTNNNNAITAAYKFIPITQLANAFTASDYENFYNLRYIPIQYKLEYDPQTNTTLSKIPYENTIYDQTLNETSILSQQGLYLVELKDKAGNLAYTYFVIDKTTPVILQKADGSFLTDYSKLNLVANDTQILWGQYKVIQTSLYQTGVEFDTWLKEDGSPYLDEWLRLMLVQKASHQQLFNDKNADFKAITLGGTTKLFLASEINQQSVTVEVNGVKYEVSKLNTLQEQLPQLTLAADGYSLEVFVVKNGTLYEGTYYFEVSDESNTSLKSVATHMLGVSSDISQTALKYSSKETLLTKHAYETKNEFESLKNTYYMPINTDIVTLQYLTTTNESTIEIGNITINYYPYITNYVIFVGNSTTLKYNEFYTLDEKVTYVGENASGLIKNNVYSVRELIDSTKEEFSWSKFKAGTSPVLAKTSTSTIVVYDYNSGINLGIASGTTTLFNYNINTEIFTNVTELNGTELVERTKAGKYQITRSYRTIGDTTTIVDSKNDFMTRTLTFILDRYSIITPPEQKNVNPNPDLLPENVLKSLVGGEIYIEVLTGSGKQENIFNQVYKAISTSLETPILETNKLPVRIAIPVMKFGQVIANDFVFFAKNLFYTNDVESYINSFEMKIEIKHIETGEITTSNHSITAHSQEPSDAYVRLTNGIYLSFTNVSNGYIELPMFTAVGTYQVLISQKNKLSQGENVSQAFTFKIVNIPPTFEIKDANGYEITADENRIHYTNTNTLRVTWTDSANNFMAKIDKNNLIYRVNNIVQPKINPNLVQTSSSGLIHYFDLDLSRYPENTIIDIVLSYENNAEDSNLTFTASKTIITDKTAPTSSIDALILNAKEPTIINASNLRVGHNMPVGYNKTVTSGIYKNFAFTVEKSALQSILTSLTNTTVYAKRVGDKYNNLSYTELDPSSPSAVDTVKNSGEYNQITNFNDLLIGEYYEIAELDLAGNLTVYTVYITDVAQQIAAEQALANQNPAYKEFLGDDLKLITFETANGLSSSTILENANAAYNVKLFAKDYFNLKNINMFGYKWFVLTFNNNKYLASPYLPNNMLYKLTATSAIETNLTNEFKLALARSNYSLTFNNTSVGTINFKIATSNQQLTFVQPTPTNPSLSINKVSANETEQVTWQSVTIWEFKSKAISAYARFNPSSPSPVEYSPEVAGFNLARYINLNATTTFTLSASLGAYYRFKVVDNFGNEYVFYTLYGNDYLDKIVTMDGSSLIQDRLETDDEDYYISNTGFKFSFFHSITSAIVKVSVFNPELKTWSTAITATITETTNYNIPFNTSGYGYFERYSSYTTIFLNPTVQIPNFKGPYVRYEITTLMTEELQEDIGTQTEVYNFKVYNLVPNLALKGKNRQDLTALLSNNANLTSDPITIEFASTAAFEYPVKTFISRNGETPYEITSGQTFTEVGTYVITRVYLGKMSNFAIQTEQFTISNAKLDFFEVVQYSSTLAKYVTVDATGEAYLVERPIQLEQTTITQHYIVNTTDFRVNLNTSQMMEEINSQEVKKAGITTFIKTLSNKNASNASSTINYFETTIAISYIPQTNKIIKANSFYYLDSQGEEKFLINSEKVLPLLKETDNTETVTIFWNNYHEIVENKISVEIRYGQSNQLLTNARIYTREGLNYTTLNRSGNYMFTFKDMAGNVHKFDYNSQIQNTSTTFNFVFISSVIFTVNGDPVIQHAVYNSDVEISVPNYTLPYYDSTGKPVIKVERNGVAYTGFTSSNSQRLYTFTESGLYQITFSAKHGGKEVKETPYYFSIIKSNELTWAFSITEFSTYYIEKIKHNNVDVTRQLTSLGLGEITKIKENNVEVEYLKNIIFSLYDEQTGSGTWEITINTNNDLKQKFTYSFKIGSANIPISISQKQGESTTDVIKVMFNARNIYEAVGDVVVVIGRTTYELNEEYFNSSKPENIELNITALGDTYIQILTPSGRLLYTYKVTRDEPLNTVAILVIVVSVLVVAGLTVMFILLRKKMQIR